MTCLDVQSRRLPLLQRLPQRLLVSSACEHLSNRLCGGKAAGWTPVLLVIQAGVAA